MPRSSNLILVTGATGYIANKLIPQLLERGYRVRALARRPERLKARKWFSQVEMIQGDVMRPSTLIPALDGVRTAYYLVHNMLSGHGYTSLEIESARNFARAAEKAGVEHIIYLGGLADPEQHIAPHMRSRIETGKALREGKVPVTEFRAGVIAGSGSISFEMIRFMTELLPIIPGPKWLKNKTQPIAAQNIMDYLLAALENHNGQGRVFEIGGPEIFTYQELMLNYARIRGHKRNFLLLPYVPAWFMAFGIGWMTPVPRPIAYALVGGLSSDSVVIHEDARKIYPEVMLIDFESVTREALKRLHPLEIERVWEDGQSGVKTIKHEGFFIDHRELKINAPPEKIIETLKALHHEAKAVESNHLFLNSKFKFGEEWMEWRVSPAAKSPPAGDAACTNLTQTAYFAPRGPGGFLYWYLLYPFHVYKFHKWIRSISYNSVVQ